MKHKELWHAVSLEDLMKTDTEYGYIYAQELPTLIILISPGRL